MRSLAFALLLLPAAPAAADEVLELLDNNKLSGTLVHYYDGVFTFRTGGQEMKVPRDKVRALSFKLPAPRAELSTPEKTFERFRGAIAKADWQTVVDCHALMYQGLLAQQLGEAGADDFKKMRDELMGATFKLQGSKVDGNAATLKVVRQKGEDIETAELRFVRENGEWKMTPQ